MAMSKPRMEYLRLRQLKPRSAPQIAPEDGMPLALPFEGMAPLLLHVVLDAFQLRDTPMERKVLVESFAL